VSVRIEAFLALEASLSARITTAWGKVSKGILPSVYLRLQQNDVLGATQLVDNLDLSPIIRQCRDYVRYVSYASILFGASRLTPKISGSKINEPGRLTPLINRTTASFAAAIVNTVGEQVKTKLYGLIQEHDLNSPSTNFAQSEGNVIFKAENTTLLRPFVEFKNPVNNEAQRMIQMISGLHTSRLAAFGFTEEANLLGVTEYMINEQLDNKICPICEEMHGKTFPVDQARGLLERTLLTDDPTELATLQPWPSQNKANVERLKGMDTEEIIMNGWHVPPYHPYCRGQLVKVGRLPRIEDTASYQAAFPTNATGDFSPSQIDVETFQSLGIDVSQEEVDQWSKEVGVAPDEVLSLMTGLSPQEMADRAFYPVSGNTDSRGYGVSMSLVANGTDEERLRVSLDMQGKGARSPWQASLDMVFEDAEKMMRVRDLSKINEHDLPDVLSSWVAAAGVMGIDQLEMAAALDPTGEFWSRYGGMPSGNDWIDVRSSLRTEIESGAILLTDAEKKKVLELLSSDDESAFWQLIDLGLPEIEKALLEYQLTMYIDLSDALVAERFAKATR